MFSKKIQRIRQSLEILENLHNNNSRLEQLVCSGLKKLILAPDIFDQIIKKDCPFKKHFFDVLENLPLSDNGHWIELFEDLALFFKQHQQLVPEVAMSIEGQQIMHHFENCGEWKLQDGKLVSTQYWAT